jgi:hypothetical protein
MQGRDILRSEKKSDEQTPWKTVIEWLTHPSENARYLKYKVEFCTARNFACALRGLKGFGFQL